MPCFKGIAVSIHADGGSLPEYGQNKQSRVSRITSYIAVPKPNFKDSIKAEPAKFAISITLLTAGSPIPYSTPKATEKDPYPQPKYVSDATSAGFSGGVMPYIPISKSENETVAAYIYFDGRAKEEVATLLRPGEETWVNSRWVQVPSSEGGGLAEREFLFREVGLETWLNGLDLKGHDAAQKLEKRRQKFERRRRKPETCDASDSDEGKGSGSSRRNGLNPSTALSQALLDDLSSSDDEPPEAAGQIKVAMFRVIASGEIKKGEYSPQFDAHDDDDTDQGNGNGIDADVEHTTSFAKPKTLDPKTISTQTVTGIDGPDKPFATFTFFYRGERQLQKMGVIPSTKTQQVTPAAVKRRSTQVDFSSLGPLKSTGTVGFSAFRDQEQEASKRRKARSKDHNGPGMSMMDDSDEDDDGDAILGKMDETDDKEIKFTAAPEDVQFTGELAEGVDRIKLKRQRSFNNGANEGQSPTLGVLSQPTPPETTLSSSPDKTLNGSETKHSTGIPIPGASATSGASLLPGKTFGDDQIVGSPLKKHRASLFGDNFMQPARPTPALGDILAQAEADQVEKNEKSGDVAGGEGAKDTNVTNAEEEL